MAFFKCTRKEAILPKVTGTKLPDLQSSRVVVVHSAQASCEGVRAFRHNDQMNMIGHQAVAQDLGACLSGLVAQQRQVHGTIAIAKENVLLMVATLSDMVSAAG